jgi:hypothetical protein
MNLSNLLHIALSRLYQAPGASGIPTLRARVQNTASHPITILTYNGLLDSAAGVSGIIHVMDSSTGKEVPCDIVQFQRVWPPTRGAFIEMAPNETTVFEIPMSTHRLEAGKKYDVVAKWAWHGLWEGGVDVAMEACSNSDTAGRLWDGPTTEVNMQGIFEIENYSN